MQTYQIVLGWIAVGLASVSILYQGWRFLALLFEDSEPSPKRSVSILAYVLLLMVLSVLIGALLAKLT